MSRIFRVHAEVGSSRDADPWSSCVRPILRSTHPQINEKIIESLEPTQIHGAATCDPSSDQREDRSTHPQINEKIHRPILRSTRRSINPSSDQREDHGEPGTDADPWSSYVRLILRLTRRSVNPSSDQREDRLTHPQIDEKINRENRSTHPQIDEKID